MTHHMGQQQQYTTAREARAWGILRSLQSYPMAWPQQMIANRPELRRAYEGGWQDAENARASERAALRAFRRAIRRIPDDDLMAKLGVRRILVAESGASLPTN